MWIFDTNGEDPITDQGTLDELDIHQNPGDNPRSISVYAEGRDTKGQILKIFFHI